MSLLASVQLPVLFCELALAQTAAKVLVCCKCERIVRSDWVSMGAQADARLASAFWVSRPVRTASGTHWDDNIFAHRRCLVSHVVSRGSDALFCEIISSQAPFKV